MKPYHIFFDFDGWLAVAHKNEPVSIMPIQTTKPGKQVVWKENRTQLSQIQENRVHHCLFLEARWIENFESEQERQERHAKLDQRYQQLKTWLQKAGVDVIEGLVSYPKSITTVDTYLPKYITEADDEPISPATE